MGGVMMNLVELVKGSSSEEEADDRCPFCGHQKIDRCRKEWSIGKDSMASRLKSSID
jgi:predicted adenine nucleotide alpha hydrolase (AANH) superfamily ATPase